MSRVRIVTDNANTIKPAVAEKLGVTYPSLTRESPLFPHIFSGEQVSIPLTYVVNAKGTVVDVISGWSSDAEKRLRELVD